MHDFLFEVLWQCGLSGLRWHVLVTGHHDDFRTEDLRIEREGLLAVAVEGEVRGNGHGGIPSEGGIRTSRRLPRACAPPWRGLRVSTTLRRNHPSRTCDESQSPMCLLPSGSGQPSALPKSATPRPA